MSLVQDANHKMFACGRGCALERNKEPSLVGAPIPINTRERTVPNSSQIQNAAFLNVQPCRAKHFQSLPIPPKSRTANHLMPTTGILILLSLELGCLCNKQEIQLGSYFYKRCLSRTF